MGLMGLMGLIGLMSADGRRRRRGRRAPSVAEPRRAAPGGPRWAVLGLRGSVRSGGDGAAAARTASAERTLLWVRIAVVVGIGVLVASGTPWVTTDRALGVVTVAIAAVYALSMAWARLHLPLELSSALDLTLTLLGVAATGGARSPTCGVVLLVVASVALRFDRSRTFAIAAAAAGGVAAVGLLVPVPHLPFAARLELSCSWATLTLLMAAVVGRLAALEAGQQLAAWTALARADAATRSEHERRLVLRALLHDVNTPLAGAQLISRSLPNRPGAGTGPVGEGTRLLRANLDYLQLLFEDMRAVVNAYDPSHVTAVVHKPFDLPELIAEAARLGEMIARGTSHELAVEVAAGVPTVVETDGAKVRRIVTNLVANAVEHAGLYGPVDVTVAAGGGNVTIGVSDRGEAIPDTFLRDDLVLPGPGHEQQRLRGVGLWVVRQLTMVLGGELHIDHREGGGNLITVTLPAPAVVTAPEPDRRLPVRHGGTR